MRYLAACDFSPFFGDAVFGRAGKGALDAEERFHHRLGVGDGEADAEGHQEGQVEEGLHPGLGEELALADDVEDGDGEGWTQ